MESEWQAAQAEQRRKAELDEATWQASEERRLADAQRREVDDARRERDAIRADRDATIESLSAECDTLGEEIDDLQTAVGWHERFLTERGLIAEFHQWQAAKMG